MPKIYRLNQQTLEYQSFELVKESPKFVTVVGEDGVHKRLLKSDDFLIFSDAELLREYLFWVIEGRIFLCEQEILLANSKKEKLQSKLKNLQNATTKD